MKKAILSCAVLCALLVTERSIIADPTAFLRTADDKNFYVAVTISSSTLSGDEFINATDLLEMLTTATDPLSQYIFSQLTETSKLVAAAAPERPRLSRLKRALAADLNRVLMKSDFYDPGRFVGIALRPETKALLAQAPTGAGRSFLNRMLLDDAYPTLIKQNSAQRPLWDGHDSATGTTTTIDVTKEIVLSLYQKGQLVPITIGPSDAFGSDFTIKIHDPQVLKDGLGSLLVAVHRYPISKNEFSGFSVATATEVATSLTLNSGQCAEGFPLEVGVNESLADKAYGIARLNTLLAYMRTTSPATRLQRHDSTTPQTGLTLKPFVSYGDPKQDRRFVACYMLSQDPPSGMFDIRFDFPPDALVELRKPFFKGNVDNSAHAAAPFSLDQGNVGKRPLEQNLDLGVQLTSSVADKQVKDAAGNDVTVRERANKGTLDMRLAPLLNVLSLPDPGSNVFKFLTPLFIDARVSTGKVNKDTLSLNRIVFGAQYEIRNYTDPQTFPTYQRYIFTFSNASDRDFKQAEWKGGFEFQPVFSKFNRPLRFRSKNFDPKLNPDPNRDQRDIPVKIGFGQQLLPVIGVEFGKTWRNKSPFAAIEKAGFVRRLYFGGTINLDLTSYVKVSLKDFFYVRGETPSNRTRNYFLGSIEVPFPSFTRQASSSAFFSFERGALPPFATPDVNAIKLGYRVQWDGWFGLSRRR